MVSCLTVRLSRRDQQWSVWQRDQGRQDHQWSKLLSTPETSVRDSSQHQLHYLLLSLSVSETAWPRGVSLKRMPTYINKILRLPFWYTLPYSLWYQSQLGAPVAGLNGISLSLRTVWRILLETVSRSPLRLLSAFLSHWDLLEPYSCRTHTCQAPVSWWVSGSQLLSVLTTWLSLLSDCPSCLQQLSICLRLTGWLQSGLRFPI